MKIRLGDLRRILAEEALGLHGAGMGEKELRNSLGYGGIELNKDGSVTDEEADAIAKKVATDKPERIYAYSRGAAALSKAALDDEMPGLPPVTYVAPAALRKWTDAPVPGVPGGSITIIGDKDSAVPVKQACKIAQQAGTPLYVFPGKSHKSILYTGGEPSGDAYEVDVDACLNDEDLPDWGPSAQGSAEDVAKQQQSIVKHRKGASKKESILRQYFREVLNNQLQEMLTIRTMVAPSAIEGDGLYAAEFIPKGTVVSKWVEGFDKVFPSDYPKSLDSSKKKSFMIYASWDGDSWFLSGDDAIYFNHSNSPNIRVIMGHGSPATWDRIAIRDIYPGEELTMDYAEIGIDPL